MGIPDFNDLVPHYANGHRKRVGGDRHKERRPSYSKSVVGIDGEGVTTASGEHLYTLLHASNGTYVENSAGLSTERCFEFLLTLKRIPRTNYLFVGFSLGYDINMMLRDLPQKHVKALLDHGRVFWKQYSIRWRQRRTFYIKNRATKRSILIYDVFGFFQCSFVKALQDWKVGDASVVAEIKAMKDKRGTFATEDAASVRTYCERECNLLVELTERLIASVNHADIPCQNWYGVGALANGMLKKHGVGQYLAAPSEELRVPVLCAYFGGRFEIAGSGHFGKGYGYDIKSAYPSVARNLPCLLHTEYVPIRKQQTKRLALYHVRWQVPKDTRFAPFPFRLSRRIYYSTNGEGWYWSSEVDAAIRVFGSDAIKIVEGYALETSCDDRPFAFIDDVYKIRQEYEAAGDYAHKALKLSLNALYGKTAQSLGSEKKLPPFQSYVWAGMITAGTRAQIIDALAVSQNSVVSIATDGLISTKPLPLPIGKQLGQWESSVLRSIFLVQPGIYRLVTTTNDVVEHTRGFGAIETSFDAIERDYNAGKSAHEYAATRFVGAAGAMMREEYGQYWRRWVTAKRAINFNAGSRFPRVTGKRSDPAYFDAATMHKNLCSEPYTPKQTWEESWRTDVDVVIDLDQP